MTHPQRLSADEILAQVNAQATLRALHGDDTPAGRSAAEGSAEPPAWEGVPVPLSAHRLLPPFPVDALPDWVAEHVAAVAEATQTPADLAGCVALAALATATGGRAVVEVRPGWIEPTNLFAVVAMPPGSRKSAVFHVMTSAILKAEQQLTDAARPRIVEAALFQKTAQSDADRTAAAATKAATPEARAAALAEASDAALQAESIGIPVEPRLIADDVTIEAAASLLAEQDGRLAVLSAEGGIFSTLAGRYNGSGGPSLDVFLKGHAGDLLRVDRKGRPAEHVQHPALTLGLAVQPDVLRDISRAPGFRGRGLLARILYSLPTNTVGHRAIRVPPVPPEVSETYDRRLQSLILTFAEWTDPARLTLTADADEAVYVLQEDIEPRLGAGGELSHLADWGSKLAGAIVRIAGLLHLAAHLTDGWRAPIEAETIGSAIRIGHYFLGHALAVFDLMGADPLQDDARALVDWIKRSQSAQFTRRDAHSNNRGRFHKATDLDPVLALLEQHGFIRALPNVAPAGRGRPASPTYEAHPSVTENTENTENVSR